MAEKYLKTPIAREAEASMALDRKPIFDKIIGEKPEPILCKCGHDEDSHLTDGICTRYNEKRECCGCIEFASEPSQEKHGLKLLKAEKVDTPERFAELMKMTNEDLKNSLKDGKILTDDLTDAQIKEKIVKNILIFKFGNMHSEDGWKELTIFVNKEYGNIINEACQQKDLQFKALLDSRIAELDGAHIWRGERCTTEERDFAIDRLEELLKEMIK